MAPDSGIRQGARDVIARVEKGETVDPADYYFRIAPLFQTAAPGYAWLNNVRPRQIEPRIQ
jgi:hypothetical protein